MVSIKKENMAKIKQQLVIIPGWDGTRETWHDFIRLAQEEFEIIFMDMPCSGQVPCPSEIWGVEEYAKFVLEKTKDLAQPALLGHSFGGQVAVNVVANSPKRFSSLILSGAAVIRPKNDFKRMLFSFVAKLGKKIFSFPIFSRFEKIAKKILYKVADSPDYDKTNGIKREIFKKVIRQDQEDKLSKIEIPTLVIWGSKDSYVPLRYGKKIVECIPNARLEIIKNGMHGLHIKNTEEFLKIIKDFLA